MNDYTTKRSEEFEKELQKLVIDLVWSATDGGCKLKESSFSHFEEPLQEWTALINKFSDSIHQAEEGMLKRVEVLAKGMLKHGEGSKCVECSISSPFCKYDMAINDFIDQELPTLKANSLPLVN